MKWIKEFGVFILVYHDGNQENVAEIKSENMIFAKEKESDYSG